MPLNDIAAAAIPTFDRASARASLAEGFVVDCRGGRVLAKFEADDPEGESYAPLPGTVHDLGRFVLPDGREAVWLGVGRSAPGAFQEDRGFLAILRISEDRLIVDAVGPWKNVTTEMTLDVESLGGQKVYVERRHLSGTGGADSSDGVQIWRETSGRISLAGTFLTSAIENRAFGRPPAGACDWVGQFNATLVYGDDLKLHGRVEWDRKHADGSVCKNDGAHREVTVTRVARWDGERLVEAHPPKDANPLKSGPP